MTGNSTNEYKDEVRRQVVQQAAKWTLAAVAGLVVIAATGWWFYLEDKIVGLAGGVPPGAVMAFDRPERCPSGWTEFTDAAGRTIVGQGSGGVDAGGIRHRLAKAALVNLYRGENNAVINRLPATPRRKNRNAGE